MTEIVPYQDKTLSTYDDIERAAKAMAGSGFFADTRQVSQAIVKIMAGRELGVGPFASMTGVNIIQGKPAFGANIMAACVKKSGRYNYRVTEMTDRNCSIEFMERLDGKWAVSGVSAFSLDDAKKAGTKNLDKFPRNMLFARAMSNGVRWFCPDVMNGSTAYTPEELGADVDEEGNIVDAPVVRIVEREPEVEPVAEPQPELIPEPISITMTIEDACKVETSKGVLYGNMPAAGIEKMLDAMWKQVKSNGLTAEATAEIEHKIKAANMVLAAKKSGEIQ